METDLKKTESKLEVSTVIRFSPIEEDGDQGVRIELEQSNKPGPVDAATLLACAVHYLIVSSNALFGQLVAETIKNVFVPMVEKGEKDAIIH